MKYTTFLRTSTLGKARLKKIKDLVEVFPTDLDSMKIQHLIELSAEAKTRISNFEKNLNRMAENDANEGQYEENDVTTLHNEFRDLYMSIESKVRSLLPAPAPTTPMEEQPPPIVNQPTPALVKLPKLELKTFNGDPLAWVTYINLFETTIHQNNSVPPVAKFQYLLSTLSGEPLNLIKSLPISEANYNVAYELLTKRYHSPRRLVSLHLNHILDLPSINASSTTHLRSFLNHFNEHSQALEALNYDVCENNHLLVAVLLRKLDNSLKKRFEASRTVTEDMPKVSDIIKFLNNECIHSEDALLHGPSHSSVTNKFTNFSSPPHPKASQRFPGHRTSTLLISNSQKPPPLATPPCFCCTKTDHKIYTCPIFKEKSPQERYKMVTQNHRCISCLGNHEIRVCKSKSGCFKCSKKHHTLLHFDNMSPKPSVPSQLTSAQTDSSLTAVHGTLSPQSGNSATVVLATTLVKLTTFDGTTHVLRALLDCCSQGDFISENAARLLNVKRSKYSQSIDGISQAQAMTNGSTHLTIETLTGQVISTHHPIQILDKITSNQPRAQISNVVLEKVKPFILADPSFHLPGPIDVLLGGTIFPKILTGENHSLGENMPHVLGTCFGFVVLGQAPCFYNKPTPNRNCFNSLTTLLTLSDQDLHSSLQRFWQIEEPPVCSKLTEEDKLCENHFINTHSRDPTGRYRVRLPFKPNHEPIGDTQTQAERRFLSLEKRFLADPELKRLYVDFMVEYKTQGHMKRCDSSLDISKEHNFLAHHAVLKKTSSTTKLRTVFDGSCKSSTQVSLNDVLMTGPKLQNSICDILLKYRCHNVVFSCDIRQMYRNILLHPDDQVYQLIYWRENPSQPLSVFQLKTLTYGLNSSPYLAIRTLHQLAYDEGENFPNAAKVLLTQTYVDDIICGSDSEEEGIALQEELIGLLKKGQFELRKWTSNSSKLLGKLPQDHQETPVFLHSSDQPHFSILGMSWSPNSDTFSYKFQLTEGQATKRQCLSWLSQIYDPCGFISPVVMWAKCFMQLLWTKGLKWDEPLPVELATEWSKFVADIKCVVEIQIPRALGLSNSVSVLLCGFSDASEIGYAAVVYVRCETENSVTVRQLISKTRVAPLKKLSVPRLELCATHLLAQLIKYSVSVLSDHCNINSIYTWTDSSIVLTWIKTPTYRLKTFVANRVAQIQEAVHPHCWHHVNTHQNPADSASRGLFASQLKYHPLWWQGPAWLTLPQSQWPTNDFSPVNLETCEEVKPVSSSVLLSAPNEEWDLLTRYSNWTKLQYVMAYILRFIHNSSHKTKKTGFLSTKELQDSSLKIFELVQKTNFSSDISSLKENKICSVKLQRLSPFLDPQGLIRVGGRLKNSSMSFEAKHPIALPKHHHVVNLLIDYYHTRNLHSGPQLTQVLLSQVVWILSARSIIRARIHKCLKCFKCKPRNTEPLMGDLPEARVTPSRCFSKTGIDLGGPFLVKPVSVRKVKHCKVYVCIFVCFITKAVHLEIVSDLTTESFLASFSRFISRRGFCQDIFSDCGSNFIGSNNALQKIVKEFWKSRKNQQEINDFCIQRSVNFHFNPPSAPHQGGLWEAAIKSMKHHLRRVIGETILTYEEFHTVTTRVEAILNSRPLTPMASDPADLSVLTPAHFLIGSSLTALPEVSLPDHVVDHRRRWQQVQVFSQQLWRRWSMEYLHTLQQRTKWLRKNINLKIGDLVLVQDARTSSLSWPLGRVVEVFPGKDSVVRVVKIKTQMGVMIRPAIKVFLLPINNLN